jgi:hypothetical protein
MSLEDPFELLPREIIVYIISLAPSGSWFLISKRINELAWEGMDQNKLQKIFNFSCQRGLIHILQRCLKVRLQFNFGN